MCYDKIESGILVLHKEKFTPLPFLQECFDGFRAEARERGVTLQFNPPTSDVNETTNPLPGLPGLPLTDTDMINVDKFKLAQIIRNLVSNALKFSPRGSVTTLQAVFVPSAKAAASARNNDRSLLSSAHQMLNRMSAKWRRRGSVSALVAAPADDNNNNITTIVNNNNNNNNNNNVTASSLSGQFTTGFLRIKVIDHGQLVS